MDVYSIDNTSFTSKNTYLQKSKHSVTELERKYFRSLHKEAKARKFYQDYLATENELAEYGNINSMKDTFDIIKIFARMASKKLNSIICSDRAYKAFPNRFVEPDNKLNYPWRYYQLKSFSGDAMPSKIKRY